MGFKVNFADTEVRDFGIIPRGWYVMRITDGEVKQSGPEAKNPGSDYINWELTIQHAPNGDTVVKGPEGEVKVEGRKQWFMTSLLPHALFSLKELAMATGRFTASQLDGDLDFNIEDFLGAEVLGQVTIEQYKDEDRNRLKHVKKIGDGPSTAKAGPSSLLPS